MKRFVLSEPPNAEGRIRLYDKDYHYLARVRRLKVGSCFDALLPGGEETRVRILSLVDNILIGECSGARQPEQRPLPPIALFQGLPRGSKMDLIVRQAAETGLSLVLPFEAEYSTARIKDSQKPQRWERIVREAMQQSGSAVKTVVKAPCTFDALLDYWESVKKEYRRPLGILLHQETLAKGSFHDYLCKDPDFAALAVGPEGGFSQKELSLFLAAGFRPLLMGNTVLRTETAALCGTAALRIIMLESESWTSKE